MDVSGGNVVDSNNKFINYNHAVTHQKEEI